MPVDTSWHVMAGTGSTTSDTDMSTMSGDLQVGHRGSIQFIYCQSVQLIGLGKDIQQMHTYVSTEE
jgi:hypothetical protein